MLTKNVFYFIPKERLANLLDLPSSFDANGRLVCKYAGESTTANIALSDYVVPPHVVRTPEMQTYLGKMGTRAEIQAASASDLNDAKSFLDRIAKQFEI